MKCLKIQDGVITSILLNEACHGRGSFLETFATLGMDISKFAKLGLTLKLDILGTNVQYL